MDVRDLVTGYYGGGGSLAERVVAGLEQHGVDVEDLCASDLYPVDQLHAGGAPATAHLLELLEVPGLRLLDLGCGIGGASRMAALQGAQVTGIDLTPEFVEAATDLTARVGLTDRACFRATPGEDLPLDDDSVDAAVMIHVGMNVPDKAAVFSEVRRVLRPGGRFAVYDQMRTGSTESLTALTYPMPWADDERSSFVESAEDYRRHLESVGFTVESIIDHTAAAAGGPRGPVNQAVLLGPSFMHRLGNNIAATEAGLLRAMIVVARA